MKLRPANIGGIHGDKSKIAPDEFAICWANNSLAITFHCHGPNLKRPRICLIPINLGAPTEQTIHTDPPSKKLTWGWDGNETEPTITPSIGCDRRCGWHGHITKGELLPEKQP